MFEKINSRQESQTSNASILLVSKISKLCIRPWDYFFFIFLEQVGNSYNSLDITLFLLLGQFCLFFILFFILSTFSFSFLLAFLIVLFICWGHPSRVFLTASLMVFSYSSLLLSLTLSFIIGSQYFDSLMPFLFATPRCLSNNVSSNNSNSLQLWLCVSYKHTGEMIKMKY